MNIGISLSGEGHGHAARITALARELQKEHKISFWAPATVHNFLKEYFPSNEIREIPYIQFIKKNHKIRLFETFYANIKYLPYRFFPHPRYRKELIERRIDALIADFEPFLPVAASSLNIPVLSFNHQAIMFRHPIFSISGISALIAARIMIPSGSKTICSSFYDGDIGALLMKEITSQKPTREEHILVYASPSIKKILLPILEKFKTHRFEIFPDEEKDFVKALVSCRGAIGPAGHQFTSECLHLKKPLIVFPQSMQAEQELNAIMVERSGWGIKGRLSRMEEDIRKFINALGSFPLPKRDNRIYFNFEDSTANAVYKVNAFLREQFSEGKKLGVRKLFNPHFGRQLVKHNLFHIP